MHKFSAALLLTAFVALTTFLPGPAWGDTGDYIAVWGTVSDDGYGMVLSDDRQDYLLLGIEDPQFLNMECEVSGTTADAVGITAIQVERIEIIGPAPDQDQIPGQDLAEDQPGSWNLPMGEAQSDTTAWPYNTQEN